MVPGTAPAESVSGRKSAPQGIVRYGLVLGTVGGLLHVVLETALLGWYGAHLSPLDLVLIAALGALVGACAGTLAGLVATVALALPGRSDDLALARRLVWSMLLAGYGLVFVKIVAYWSGWGTAGKWFAVAAPVLLFCWLAGLRATSRPFLLAAFVCASTTLCALQLMQAEWSQVAESARPSLVLGLTPPILLALASLVFVLRSHPTETRPTRSRVTLASGWIAAVALVTAVVTSVFPRSTSWRVHEEPARAERSPLPSPPLNVILIVLDTVRADHLDLFGYDQVTMPNLRRFAETEATSVIPMVTTSPWTLPSHAAMFTGLYPSAHGAHHPSVHGTDSDLKAYTIRDDVPTLAEFLRDLGYDTAGIVANIGWLSGFGIPRGFTHYDARPAPFQVARTGSWLYRLRVGRMNSVVHHITRRMPRMLLPYVRVLGRMEPGYRRAAAITSLAEEWLEQRDGDDEPFFLFLNYLDAHAPCLPIGGTRGDISWRVSEDEWYDFSMERHRAWQRESEPVPPGEMSLLTELYDGELRDLDRELGRLFAYLRTRPFFERTLVFITTDHGESFLEHGYVGHGNSLHSPETGGFLITKVPEMLGPVEPSENMQFVDFFPTVAASLSRPIPDFMQGSPWGAGRDYALAEAFCPSCAREARTSQPWPDRMRHDLVAVVADGWKLVRSTHEPDRVYRVESDPGELQPLSGGAPEFTAFAGEAIEARASTLARPLPESDIDPALLDKLRSLGYVK